MDQFFLFVRWESSAQLVPSVAMGVASYAGFHGVPLFPGNHSDLKIPVVPRDLKVPEIPGVPAISISR